MKVIIYGKNKIGILCVAFIAALIIIFFSENIIVHILSFAFFCAIPMLFVKFDLLHPYCWLSAFFGIYSLGFPIIIALGLSSRTYYTKEVMIYQLIALFVVLLVIGPRNIHYSHNIDTKNFNINIGVFNKVIFFLLATAIIIVALYVRSHGYSGKDEIYARGGVFINMVFKMPLVLSLLSAISFISTYSSTKRVPIKQMLFTAMALGIITIFSGERDFVFRYILVMLLVMWFFGIIKRRHIIILAPLLALLIPLSATYKYFFTKGTKAAILYSNMLFAIVHGEFESASCNLQILLNDSENTKGTFGVFQLFKDVASAFYSKIPSTGSWFNKRYYPHSVNVQYGFSLVGEGYLIGGLLGVILLFIIVGLITKYFYIHSFKNIYYLGGYIYYITAVIYSLRGDFSNITSAIVKQIGLVLLILYIMNRFAKRNAQGVFERKSRIG